MNLKINDRFSIRSDNYQYIIVETKIGESGKAKGKKIESNYGYVRTLKGVADCLFEREELQSKTLDEAVERIEKLKADFEKVANRLDK